MATLTKTQYLQEMLNRIMDERQEKRDYYLEMFALAYSLATEVEDFTNYELVEQMNGNEITWFVRKRKDEQVTVIIK